MENNFENHIKSILDNPPDFPFDQRLWEDMESRLDDNKNNKPQNGFAGRLPLLIMLLFTSALAGFFYFKHYKATERIAAIEKQLLSQNQTQSESKTNQHLTVVYDTIFNTVVVNTVQDFKPDFPALSSGNQFRGLNTIPNSTLSYPDFKQFSFETDWDLLSQTPYFSSISMLNFGAVKNYTQTNEKNVVDNQSDKNSTDAIGLDPYSTATRKLEVLALFPLDNERSADLPDIFVPEISHRKPPVFYLDKLKPTRISVSGTAGTFTSLNLGGNGFNLRGSAHVEVGFGERFSGIVGIEYFTNDFNKEIDVDNPEELEGFPDLPPLNEEDILQNIQGDFNYLQIPIGIKYMVFQQKHLFPFLSAGVIAGGTSKSRLEYDYFSSTIGNYPVSQGNLLPRDFELSAFWTSIGFEIELNRNWSFLMEGSSQFDFNKGKYRYENLQILKLSTGVQYEF